jgi:HSP20 family protein
MTQLLPEGWRQALARLRDDIHRAFDRWFARRSTGQRRNGSKGLSPMPRSAPVEQLRADINNILDFWAAPPRVLEAMWSAAPASDGNPSIDMEETDEEIIVTAEVPGLDKDQITVEVVGDRLMLRGERRRETEERKGGYYYSERSYGAFTRIIALPREVDAAKASGKYKDGLLRITLPKTARSKAKRIAVAA